LAWLSTQTPIFTYQSLVSALSENRTTWGLAKNTGAQTFIEFLLANSQMQRIDLPFPYRKELLYTWGSVSLLSILLTLKKGSYFSHHTAMRINGLTELLPDTIYLNHEQQPQFKASELEQNRIDSAFKRGPRISQNCIDINGFCVRMINGMNTKQAGVDSITTQYFQSEEEVAVRVTSVERTLIDIAVRPAYSGGVAQVLDAYAKAKERVSPEAMLEMYKKLNYTYPYHQAIGFYMEKAGYDAGILDLFRQLPISFDFYLAHEMGKTRYVKDWRLHVPDEF